MNRFLVMLKQKLREKKSIFQNQFPKDEIKKISSFHDFDGLYVAPIHGFKDAEDYWSQCSGVRFIPKIKRSTLLINAQDDSFLGSECYPKDLAKDHPCFYLECPKQGGHVGFIDRKIRGPLWSEKRALEFLLVD